jgi:HAD superfamily hydrolase (TIGR01549 family)
VILLLDLDDTLLGNSMDAFLPGYLQGLAKRMARFAEPDKMVKFLMAGTRQMMANLQPDLTLAQVFDSVFYPGLGLQRVDVQPTIDVFYAQDFPGLRSLTEFRPQAIELVKGALARGYRVAIATNPLFPRTAILQRVAWAGISPEKYPIALIPDYESFHFAKPNVHYYAEFLGQLGWPEEPVVMVGDDLENDILPARRLGLPVFWVNNPSAEWNGPGEPPARGGLADILPWLDVTPAEQLMPDYSSPTAMLTILRTTPAVLLHACLGKTASELSVRPAEGEWSPGEVLCHLRDVEREVFLPRLQKVTQEDNPFLSGRDTDQWAEERRYIEQDGLQALQDFTQTRMEQLALLEELKPEEWSRSARHAIFGPTRLHELVNITAGHDRLHIRQVYRSLGL